MCPDGAFRLCAQAAGGASQLNASSDKAVTIKETLEKQRTGAVPQCADRDSNPGLGVGNA